MKDQRLHWNNAHAHGVLRAHSHKQTKFAEQVNGAISPGSSILELGCGEGNDSIYFAASGHTMTATDFSDTVIADNKKNYSHNNLQFCEQDISMPLAFNDQSFDVVYARLSLHYFSDKITHLVFDEIRRVLKPDGALYFMCKSTSDGLYGQGEELEPDMYELDGHVRHFFSKSYVEDLLQKGWKIENVTEGKDTLYGRPSAFIAVTARKN